MRQRSQVWGSVAVAVLMTVAVGLLSPLLIDDPGARWAGYVAGAVLAVALWVGLFFGQWGARAGKGGRGGRVLPSASSFLSAAAIAVALGTAMVLAVGNLAGWSIGAVLAIATSGGWAARRTDSS
ncbi:hypothetical protein BCF74_11096 [Knoellia remsis]|uniref:Uncharacterized protein n=1 Tax=Knoellia remsis TaxID=407159 RepID=A0A2T0UN51_9MICO|nr:hypothetical protein [Knoellia remsis]PRY59359.1 hypothetical protein BCF74_11096 [Knoellia remsis]